MVISSTTHNHTESHHHSPDPTSSLLAKHQIPYPLFPSPPKHHQTILGPQENSPNPALTILNHSDDLNHHSSSLEHLISKDSRDTIFTSRLMKPHQSPHKPSPSLPDPSYMEALKGVVFSYIIHISQAISNPQINSITFELARGTHPHHVAISLWSSLVDRPTYEKYDTYVFSPSAQINATNMLMGLRGNEMSLH